MFTCERCFTSLLLLAFVTLVFGSSMIASRLFSVTEFLRTDLQFQFDGWQIIAVQPALTGVYNYICRTLGFPDVNTVLLRR